MPEPEEKVARIMVTCSRCGVATELSKWKDATVASHIEGVKILLICHSCGKVSGERVLVEPSKNEVSSPKEDTPEVTTGMTPKVTFEFSHTLDSEWITVRAILGMYSADGCARDSYRAMAFALKNLAAKLEVTAVKVRRNSYALEGDR